MPHPDILIGHQVAFAWIPLDGRPDEQGEAAAPNP